MATIRSTSKISPKWVRQTRKYSTYLGIHRMTCRFWHELCGRQLRVPPISESQLRARLKKIGYQLGKPPGYVFQIFPPEYLESGGQRR